MVAGEVDGAGMVDGESDDDDEIDCVHDDDCVTDADFAIDVGSPSLLYQRPNECDPHRPPPSPQLSNFHRGHQRPWKKYHRVYADVHGCENANDGDADGCDFYASNDVHGTDCDGAFGTLNEIAIDGDGDVHRSVNEKVFRVDGNALTQPFLARRPPPQRPKNRGFLVARRWESRGGKTVRLDGSMASGQCSLVEVKWRHFPVLRRWAEERIVGGFVAAAVAAAVVVGAFSAEHCARTRLGQMWSLAVGGLEGGEWKGEKAINGRRKSERGE